MPSASEFSAHQVWLYLFLPSLLLVAAVACGFAAFAVAAAAVYPQRTWDALGPIVVDAMLVGYGSGLFLWRFWQIYPGRDSAPSNLTRPTDPDAARVRLAGDTDSWAASSLHSSASTNVSLVCAPSFKSAHSDENV